MVDDRGRSKGEGVVEYERKPSALDALRRCSEGAFFLTASLRPVIVELVEEADDEDGLMDKALPKRNQEFGMEREVSQSPIQSRFPSLEEFGGDEITNIFIPTRSV